MATKTRNVRRTTTLKTTPKRRRRTTVTTRKKQKSNVLFNTLVPLVFIVGILFCLGFLFMMGYRTVTASTFFDMKRVDIKGTTRVSRDEIEKIVRNQAEGSGVWNSELAEIKTDVEQLAFVREAIVSRILPDGIQVQVNERIPRAIVRINTGDFWVDDEGSIVAQAGKNEIRSNSLLRGWDESRSDRSVKDNQERVRLFGKIREELHGLGIEKKVTSIDLEDLQDVVANVEDSGMNVAIRLGKEDLGKRLQRALTIIEGKGQTIESLISHGGNVVAKYRVIAQ